MATKADFTDAEWDALHKGLTGAGMLVSLSDPGFTDTFGEAKTLAKFLQTQHEKGETELMRELAKVHSGGFHASAEKLQKETMAALGTAVEALAAKAPDEVDPYRRLVLAAAEAVAEAKGGVKESETAEIEQIKAALG